MSRSRKKRAFVWISKSWDKFKEKSFRRRNRDQLNEIIIDPDKDWEEANYKKLGEWGTRCGFEVEPDEHDPDWWQDEYDRIRRK